MKTLTFPYIIELGKFDTISNTIQVELEDEDIDRLKKHKDDAPFRTNEALVDLYNYVLDSILEPERERLRSDPEPVLDMLQEEAEDEEEFDETTEVTDEQIEDYLDSFQYYVDYPENI